ncbi:30S ribosomal protein S1 isoform X1 [Populus alba x Populus x berolinensis]|nr:30S ribosomal protein S1 isoform X1 [Populus alba x Populus x berolinensis]
MPIFSVTQGSLTLAGLSAFLSQHHHHQQQQQQIFATTDHASPFFTITSPLFIPPLRTRRSTNNITAKFSVSANAKAENSSETATTTATDEVLEPSPDALRQARRSADWKAVKAYYDGGNILQGRVEGFNGGGLIVRFYSLVGFLPFPLLSPSHSCKDPQKTIHEIAKDLTGLLISVKVIHAEEENRKLIFSEKEAVWSKFSKGINVGEVFAGRVGSVEDYGAFIHLRFPDGLYHLTGLVHVSEVSWDLVQDVRDILNVGDEVTVKIIDIDQGKSRITLSIKQLEEDPLLETLDKVIPQDGSIAPDPLSMHNSITIEPLPGLESIFQELTREDGIDDIRISRQGFEKRVVSQDLQLWLSNAPPINRKFTLLARAGRQVQEIQLTTTLDQDGIKKALQRVLERVP